MSIRAALKSEGKIKVELRFEVLAELVLGWLAAYPVAFVRWALGGFKKDAFNTYLLADTSMNVFFFCMICLAGVMVYQLVEKLIG